MRREAIEIKAFHLKQTLDIRAVKASLALKSLSENNTELFYKTGGNQYIFIIHYGAVVFYNYQKSEIDSFFEQLSWIDSNDVLIDEFDLVESDDTYIDIQFSHLAIKQADDDAIKILLLNMAQSIALSYYDTVSQQLISEVRVFTNEMEQHGRLKINTKNILKFICKTLNTQNRIAENLYIFDAPPITWENEYYNALNNTLTKHFELNARYRSIENTLKIMGANLHAFMEVNNHRESSRLEWIIIILILVEVIDTFVAKAL